MIKPGNWNFSASKTLDILVEKYPRAFFPKDSTDTMPLRIGIFPLITGPNPDIPRPIIGAALKIYVSKDRYLRALATRIARVDLDGNPFEPGSEAHRLFAIAELADRQERKIRKAA